eukprot:403340205
MNRNADISPSKASTMRNKGGSPHQRNLQASQQNQQSQDPKELFFGLTEKEIEIENLKTIIVAQDQKIKVIDSVREDLQMVRDQLRESEQSRLLMQEQLRLNSIRALEESQKNQKFQETLIMENKRLQSELDKVKMERYELEKDLGQKNITIQMQTERNLQLTAEIEALRQELQRKEDVERQLQTANDIIGKLSESKAKIQRDLETASDYLLEQEAKTYKANKTSLELLRQLKDAEIEIETLKNYIIELKQRIAVYIPIKDDAVDRKLAEFINNYPERSKLKIMFMRESEGVYQFGSKRVFVRVDKDKINIRVGGGYLSIDEFLDQYTPQELEKMERKDPLKKFSEKVAVQKTILGKDVREGSPVRSPERNSSPTRGSQIKQ